MGWQKKGYDRFKFFLTLFGVGASSLFWAFWLVTIGVHRADSTFCNVTLLLIAQLVDHWCASLAGLGSNPGMSHDIHQIYVYMLI